MLCYTVWEGRSIIYSYCHNSNVELVEMWLKTGLVEKVKYFTKYLVVFHDFLPIHTPTLDLALTLPLPVHIPGSAVEQYIGGQLNICRKLFSFTVSTIWNEFHRFYFSSAGGNCFLLAIKGRQLLEGGNVYMYCFYNTGLWLFMRIESAQRKAM